MSFIAFAINKLNNAVDSGHHCLTPFWIPAVVFVEFIFIMVIVLHKTYKDTPRLKIDL